MKDGERLIGDSAVGAVCTVLLCASSVQLCCCCCRCCRCRDKPGRLFIWGRRQMPQSGEEFHQVVTILDHIWFVPGVIEIWLAFCCPLLGREEVNVQLSALHFQSTVGTDWGCRHQSVEHQLVDCFLCLPWSVQSPAPWLDMPHVGLIFGPPCIR